MGDVDLGMIWKRLDDIQADMKGMRSEPAQTNEHVSAVARAMVSVQRDIRVIQRDVTSLNDRITVLAIAVDEHPPAHA